MQDQTLYSQINNNPTFPEQEHLKCPRCDSPNTKFCYFNNYNLSQPRHYCKNCKRYWTKGGILRNIPVGGGTRKNSKRSSTTKKPPSSTTTPSTSSKNPSASSVAPSVSSSIAANLSLGGFVNMQIPGSGSGSGSGSVEGRTEKNNSNTSSCWNSGSDWSHLAIFTPGSNFQ